MDIHVDLGLRQCLMKGYPYNSVPGPLYESCREASPADRHFIADGLLWVNVDGHTRLSVPKDIY